MNIETVLRAAGLSSFNRLSTFLKSLYIKNIAEANLYKTTDSENTYDQYELAYEGVDNITDYTYGEDDLIKYGFTQYESVIYTIPSEILKISSDNRVKTMLSDYRKLRIKNYIELNQYYRPFLGLPMDSSEYIKVLNNDSKNTNDIYIYLHQVNIDDYPLTYNRLYIKGEFQNIVKAYSYTYLNFIENPLSAYVIHNAPQFEIISYSTSALESSEMKYFFKCYNSTRGQILEIDYIQGYEDNYFEYSLLMLSFVLYGAVSSYNNYQLERYSLRNYTLDEMYAILDSKNLSKLKTLDPALLSKVINRLPDLINNRGKNEVINIIFDIVADKSLAIKRYYLNKKYKTDTEGNLYIDPTKVYEESVNLTFGEKTIKAGSDAIATSDIETDYTTFVQDDDTWGGVTEVDDDDAKKIVKEKLRKKLLSLDFSYIVTKYISVSKIINVYEKITTSSDLLALFYQINDIKNNFMNSDTITVNGIDANPIAIYAAWCWAYSKYNGLTNPDYILSSPHTLTDIMLLRNSEGITQAITDTGNIKISLGNGYTKKLSKYFTSTEFKNLLVKFNYNDATTIGSILNQYDDNEEIVSTIKSKIVKASTVEEYNVWSTLLKANITSKRLTTLFGGSESYSGYITNKSKTLFNYIEPIINYSDATTLKNLVDTLHTKFSDYVYNKTGGKTAVYIDEESIVGGENLNDVVILLNEFMSIFTQIYKTDFHVGFDDESINNLKLLYSEMLTTCMMEDLDIAQLKYYLTSDTHYLLDENFSINLSHYTEETLLDNNDFSINKFVYTIIGELIQDSILHGLEFDYDLILDESLHPVQDKLSILTYVETEIKTS